MQYVGLLYPMQLLGSLRREVVGGFRADGLGRA